MESALLGDARREQFGFPKSCGKRTLEYLMPGGTAVRCVAWTCTVDNAGSSECVSLHGFKIRMCTACRADGGMRHLLKPIGLPILIGVAIPDSIIVLLHIRAICHL